MAGETFYECFSLIKYETSQRETFPNDTSTAYRHYNNYDCVFKPPRKKDSKNSLEEFLNATP